MSITPGKSSKATCEQRIVCWFSCGAASALAAKMAIEENKKSSAPKELIVVSIYIKEEHPDSHRFLKDCEKWFGQKIIILQQDKYNASVDEVIKKERYMSGPYGAKCTKVLKKEVRYKFQRHDDIHVFGMTSEEEHRIDQLIDNENELQLWSPLIDGGMTKKDCFSMLTAQRIELPEMYKLGYNNNNCIGCVKATGAGYWNKIRTDFPDTFKQRAKQEELLNVSLVRLAVKKFKSKHPGVVEAIEAEETRTGRSILKQDKRGSIRVPLRFLPVNAGSHKSINVGDCGFFCEK